MVNKMKNANYFTVNIDNLLTNIDAIKKEYQYSNYILDVSNDASSRSMKIISYIENDFNYLYVHDLQDVLKIRKYNKIIPTIYDGVINEDNIFDLIVNNAIIVLKRLKTLEDILKLNIKDNLDIILNIDTSGYNGFEKKEDILFILDEIKKNKYLKIIGIQSVITEESYQSFKHIITPLKDLNLVILNHEHDKSKIKGCNAIKLSSSIYGNITSKKSIFKRENTLILPTLVLNSTIIDVKRKLKHKKEVFIGVIPIGTIHGLNNDTNKVLINNQYFYIKEILENYSLIEVNSDIKVSDKVELLINNYQAISKNIPIIFECKNKEQVYN